MISGTVPLIFLIVSILSITITFSLSVIWDDMPEWLVKAGFFNFFLFLTMSMIMILIQVILQYKG